MKTIKEYKEEDRLRRVREMCEGEPKYGRISYSYEDNEDNQFVSDIYTSVGTDIIESNKKNQKQWVRTIKTSLREEDYDISQLNNFTWISLDFTRI